jgi:VanZ family protein
MLNFFRFWLPVVIWCAIIFFQSAFATPDVVPSWPYIDKVAHIGVYALLGMLLYRALQATTPWRLRPIHLLVAATILATLYGLSDEWHQSFVVERTADLWDLFADLIGAGLGSSGYLLIMAKFRKGNHQH